MVCQAELCIGIFPSTSPSSDGQIQQSLSRFTAPQGARFGPFSVAWTSEGRSLCCVWGSEVEIFQWQSPGLWTEKWTHVVGESWVQSEASRRSLLLGIGRPIKELHCGTGNKMFATVDARLELSSLTATPNSSLFGTTLHTAFTDTPVIDLRGLYGGTTNDARIPSGLILETQTRDASASGQLLEFEIASFKHNFSQECFGEVFAGNKGRASSSKACVMSVELPFVTPDVLRVLGDIVAVGGASSEANVLLFRSTLQGIQRLATLRLDDGGQIDRSSRCVAQYFVGC